MDDSILFLLIKIVDGKTLLILLSMTLMTWCTANRLSHKRLLHFHPIVITQLVLTT